MCIVRFFYFHKNYNRLKCQNKGIGKVARHRHRYRTRHTREIITKRAKRMKKKRKT